MVSSVGSAPAPGSVIEKLLRSSPRSSGCIHRSFCSGEPPMASSSALPESGALLPKIARRVPAPTEDLVHQPQPDLTEPPATQLRG